ncbi:hypothetical protein [Bartonella sp. F02]|uniref:hypothetical protein n=1 Tax=Bartonella sp. F02 TaxID=2967262 RepID=UPI0022A97220|nr:hypothetical protein [Bartonella sp. F02]MCZ2328924.1 hypothetical protein [Bartonella sp. F02]
MSAYNLRRFAQPDVLKNIHKDNLITFLELYENYLTERGFNFNLNADNELDYETLCEILLNPTENMDLDLVDALFFIQEMSDSKHFEELSEQAIANNLNIPENSTTADLALALWLHNPEILKRLHAEVIILKPKSFIYFQSDQKSSDIFPLPKDEVIRTLEKSMDAWFYEKKRGTGCRIITGKAEDENKTYFLIRHGMPLKREGKIESGKSQTILYRPEFHDVIVYDCVHNELAVFNKSGAKKERMMYLDLFSQHLFGQKKYFPNKEKYTLQPLIDKGENALACIDIDGIETIKLIEIQLQFRGRYNDKNTLRSSDIFASLSDKGKSFPTFGELVSASFSVKFDNAKRPRTVKVRPPNVASFDRKEDSHLIETWLRKCGFVNKQQEEESNPPVTHKENHDAVSNVTMV